MKNLTKNSTKKVIKNSIKNYKTALNNLSWLNDKSRITFRYLAGINRPIKPAQVTVLSYSINEMGIIRPIIVAQLEFITGKKEYYIIDGQHLFNACIRNGMDIPYIVIDIADKKELIETMALLNASSKSWILTDYTTAWSALTPDYVKLNHYFQVYDIEMNMIAGVLSGNSLSSGASITKKIKNGEFRIVNEAANVKILDNVTDVLKIVPRMNRYENRYLCNEYVKFMKEKGCNYSHNKFLDFLTKNKEKFVLATHEEGKLSEMFNKIK